MSGLIARALIDSMSHKSFLNFARKFIKIRHCVLLEFCISDHSLKLSKVYLCIELKEDFEQLIGIFLIKCIGVINNEHWYG